MTPGDIFWSLVFVAGLLFAVIAAVQILRSQLLTDGTKVAWMVVVLLAPYLGALIWFAFSTPARRRRATLSSES